MSERCPVCLSYGFCYLPDRCPRTGTAPMSEALPFRVGDDVRIGNGRKVYQVSAVVRDGYLLAATSWHTDAAQRVQDALRVYTADELTKVRRR